MKKSIVQIVITATVDMSPEDFIEDYNTILIRKAGVYLHNIKDGCVELHVEDFDITGIEEL